MEQPIRVYNTLSREKQKFTPERDNLVRIYACGVTPYADAHIGHARPTLFWSVVRKYLVWRGYDVKFVQNFTDVDDKIIERAAALQEDALGLAARYSEKYLQSMRRLGIEDADHYPLVSEHIKEIVEMIEGLVAKDVAYVVDGDVYYDVSRFPEYGKLSGQRPEELMAGTRFEADERKRHPMDFALWKASKPGEPAWDSPWGSGRPGWHIECSAMSLKYLGNRIDFHGGGLDLVFPHHENEIAQSEAYIDEAPFVRFWVHTGLVNMSAEKMSKSIGNVADVDDLLDEHPASLLRFYLLNTHYRSPLEFSDEAMAEARRGWQRLNGGVAELRRFLQSHHMLPAVASDEAAAAGDDWHRPLSQVEDELARLDAALADAHPHTRHYFDVVKSVPRRFDAVMADDFNTALATAVLFELVRGTNGFRQQLEGRVAQSEAAAAGDDAEARSAAVTPEELQLLQHAYTLLHVFGGRLLGVLQSESELETRTRRAGGQLTDSLVAVLIELRQRARERKDWHAADFIRYQLRALGIILEDTPAGTRWKYDGDA